MSGGPPAAPRNRGALLLVAAGGVLLLLILWLVVGDRRRPAEPPPAADTPAPVAPEEGRRRGPLARRPITGVEAEVLPFERRIAGRLDRDQPRVRPLTGPLRLRARQVVWDDPAGRPFARAPLVTALVDAGAAARGDIVVRSARLESPEVFLIRDAAGVWSYERALGLDVEPERPPERVRTILFEDVRVARGRAVVRLEEDQYFLRDVAATLSRVSITGPGVAQPRADIATFAALVEGPGLAEEVRLATTGATLRFAEDRLLFDFRELRLDGTILADGSGEWRYEAPGLGVEGRARVQHLAFADVRRLFPELAARLPEEGTATFTIAVEPRAGERLWLRLGDMDVRTGGSRVTGFATVLAGGGQPLAIVGTDLRLDPLQIALIERFTGPLPYGGRVTGRIHGVTEDLRFDLVARLVPEVGDPFTASIGGRAGFSPDGLTLRRLDADLESVPLAVLRVFAPALPLRGMVTGRVTLHGPPGQVPLELAVRLDMAEGAAIIEGTLDLTGAVPTYDLSGRLIGVNLQALFEPAVPPVYLTAGFSVAGRGFALATADARLSLNGRFTGWGAGPADTVVARASVRGGTLTADTVSLSLRTLAFQAGGTWRFVEPIAGQVAYSLAIDSLAPFAPYLPGLGPDDTAAGSIAAAGTLAGTLERPHLTGEARLTQFRFGAWAAEGASATFDVAPGDTVPVVRVRAVAVGLITPGGREFSGAHLELDMTPPVFALELRADQADGGVLEIVADGQILLGQEQEAFLRRLTLTLEEERWQLVQPAAFRWGGPAGLRVEGFRVEQVDGEGLIALDGALAPTAETELRLEVLRLPVGDLVGLVGIGPDISGLLSATAVVRGPQETPTLELQFQLLDGVLDGVPVRVLDGSGRYAGQRLDLLARATFAEGDTLRLDASLPIALTVGIPPSFDLLETEPLRVEVIADSLPLNVFPELAADLRDPQGLVHGRAVITGTFAEPVLDGTIRLEDGAITVTAMNQRYESIQADITLENRRLVVRELRASSGGWITASGFVQFEDLGSPAANLEFRLDRFRPIGVDNLPDAEVSGTIRITGPVANPVVSGNVTLADGNIRAPAPAGADELDAELVQLLPPTPGRPREEPWFRGVIIQNLVIRAGDDLWFITEQARARLAGTLTVNYAPGATRIVGELAGDRGTFTLRVGPIVRRFEIREARVRFFGAPTPNPALDITAARVIQDPAGGRLEVLVNIGGTLNSPTLNLATAAGTPIPESQLLSFVLFGQPTLDLGEGLAPGRGGLAEALLLGGIADLAALELEQALMEDLGIPVDVVQIRTAPGSGFAGIGIPTVMLGWQLTERLFVSVETGLAAIFEPSIRLEWRIDPQWTVTAALEPVARARYFRHLGTFLPVAGTDQQFTVDIRRRWTY
jgi:translocation and assembly module TamB